MSASDRDESEGDAQEADRPQDGDEARETDRPQESDEVRDASPLARFFFLKTTFAILLVAVLTVGGLFAYGMLTKEALPDLDIPRATITTTWPGADARSIEEQVTDNIEDELTSLSGVRSIDSASYDSFSVISVEFEASVNSETAMAELRAAVSDAEAELPEAAGAADGDAGHGRRPADPDAGADRIGRRAHAQPARARRAGPAGTRHRRRRGDAGRASGRRWCRSCSSPTGCWRSVCRRPRCATR
ncbi:MAG: efflux RND transporter permease subunit [Sphingomonas paucimobilis]